MEETKGMDSCILKRQLYYEYDKYFLKYNKMNVDLFIEYISYVIKYYERGTDDNHVNNYLTSNIKLKEFLDKFCDEIDDYGFTMMSLKPILADIYNVSILISLLSFFIGKNEAHSYIYVK